MGASISGSGGSGGIELSVPELIFDFPAGTSTSMYMYDGEHILTWGYLRTEVYEKYDKLIFIESGANIFYTMKRFRIDWKWCDESDAGYVIDTKWFLWLIDTSIMPEVNRSMNETIYLMSCISNYDYLTAGNLRDLNDNTTIYVRTREHMFLYGVKYK